MPSRYFDLSDDVHVPGRWDLGTPVSTQGRELDDYLFTRGEPVTLGERLRIPLRGGDGAALDFSEAGLGVPVVSARVAAVFAEWAPQDVQLLPVEVEAHAGPFFLLVCTRLVRCIDDEACDEVRYWMPEDGRPEKTGRYRSVSGLRIDPARVGQAKVFRPWGWDVVLIVSEDIHQALERMGATGTRFQEVTGQGTLDVAARERARKSRELLETADATRDAFWRTLGVLDEEALMPIAMSDAWPGRRQLWRVIRREDGQTLLVTHGLSDPFIERLEPSVGWGLELALEVDASVKDVSKGWPLLLLSRVADEVAGHTRVRAAAKAGLSSMEVAGKGLPKSLLTVEGRGAVLLGTGSPTLPEGFSTPDGDVKLVTVQTLLPSELTFLLQHGAEGQAVLARRLAESGAAHLSRPRRKPVV